MWAPMISLTSHQGKAEKQVHRAREEENYASKSRINRVKPR